MPSIHKDFHKRLHYFCLLGIILFYPFSVKFCNAFILLLFFNRIFWLREKESRVLKRENLLLTLILIAPTLLELASLFYTQNLHEGIRSLEKKIPFVVFPIVLGTSPRLQENDVKKLFRWTLYVVVMMLLILLFFAVKKFLLSKSTAVFFWRGLTEPLSLHPSYVSLLLLFLFFYVLIEKPVLFGNFRKSYLIPAVLFPLFVLLLSSKLYLVILILAIGTFVAINLKKSKRWLIVGIFSVLILIPIFTKTSIGDRFSSIQMFHYKIDDPISKFNELTIRLALIECSWKVIKDNFILGVGVGDVDNKLMQVYKQVGYKFGYLDQQNPHDQYLSVWLATGVIGLLAFLFVLFKSSMLAIQRKNYLHLFFLGLFVINFFVESVLERQKGIVLFALFNALFLFHSCTSKPAESSHSTALGGEG